MAHGRARTARRTGRDDDGRAATARRRGRHTHAALPGTPAPASGIDRADQHDDDHDQHDQQYAAAIAAALRAADRGRVGVFRAGGSVVVVKRGVEAQVEAVDLNDPFKQRGEQLLSAGGVVLCGKIRLEVVEKHIVQIAGCDVVLQSLALHEPVIVVVDGHEQQNAVVFVAGADAPAVEQRVGVVLDGGRAGGGHGDKDDLRAAGGIELVVVEHDQALDLVA